MTIIKDLKILKRLSEKFNFKIDNDFKYIVDDTVANIEEMKKEGYFIKYFDGCFYPFLVKK